MNQPVAIITGAGSGIGRETARELASRGYALSLAGRRVEALRETAALLGPEAQTLCIPADVGDSAACADIVRQTLERFGRLDALINNAGYAPLAPIDKSTPALIHEAYRVNAIGPACLIAAAWPTLIGNAARGLAGGVIVNVSTMGTVSPFPGFFAYAAAKAALNVMAKSCAGEGKRHNVRAFAVAPGAVETGMLRGNFSERALPPAKTLPPGHVARVIAECVTGQRDNQNGETILVPSP